MKSGRITEWLHTLFSFCFAQSILPSVWHKAFITPIPKSADKDPFVPLNYRGISLLSCVFKVYTGILNFRITQYCENNVFTSSIRNRKNCGLAPTWHLWISKRRSIGLTGIYYCTSLGNSTKFRVIYITRSNAFTLKHYHVSNWIIF